ncbi:MAG: FAD/NAD(P)-binding protein [Candidatus Micrarchaeota archaeon]
MEDPYLPKKAKILKIAQETTDIKTFFLESVLPEHFPGQFVELTVYGVGEAPISISSVYPDMILTVKKIGSVTNALFDLKEGDCVGIRGPYGKGWPISQTNGKNVILICGGVGLPPLRPIISSRLAGKTSGSVILCYGARTPDDMVYREELEGWQKKGVSINTTVDTCPIGWKGNVGVVTCIIDLAIKKDDSAICMMCGPPVMMKFAAKMLLDKGFSKDQIYVSLERMMKCGVGKCGHCMAGGKYACKDGPVFRLDELEKLPEKML